MSWRKRIFGLGIALALLSLQGEAYGQTARAQHEWHAWESYSGTVSMLYVRGVRKDDIQRVVNRVRTREDGRIALEFKNFKAGKMPGRMSLACEALPNEAGSFSVQCQECVEFDMPLVPMLHYDAKLSGRIVDGELEYQFELVNASVLGVNMEVVYRYSGHRAEQ